jgi:hypothetical protein
MGKRAAFVGLALVLVVLVCLAVWRAPLLALRSLASLRRVDGYPLYVMHYYGDYGFSRLLEPGTARTSAPGLEMSGAWACTGFAGATASGGTVVGRNFDWHNRQALLLFTHPPGAYASVSMVDTSYLGFPREDPTWADRRVLLQAPYLPFDGMNERGLAVGMMAVPHARDRPKPQGVTLDDIQAIRLLLDYAADVEEAVSLLEGVTVRFGNPPLHFFVADASGHSAVIEYLDGEMVVTRNEGPWQVSTNFLLAEERPAGAASSCWRYNLAYERLAQANGVLSAADAMALLEDVSQPITMWSVVYDLGSGAVDVALGRQYERVHSFRLPMD